MAVLHTSVYFPSDLLEALGEHTGHFWSDPAMEPFLPEGTRLRASFDRKSYFAVVEGTEIKYGEYAISPSCFANLHGSGNRNAWKAIWLRFPGSAEWLLADVCRSAKKAAIARLLGSETEHDNGSQRKRSSGRGARRKRRSKQQGHDKL